MVLILGLGVAVIVAIAVAILVLRSGRTRDHDRQGGNEADWESERDTPRPRRSRRGPEDSDEWSIDDYRSAHPIRGKYAAPADGARRAPVPGPGRPESVARPGGYQPGGYGADHYDNTAVFGQNAAYPAPEAYGGPGPSGGAGASPGGGAGRDAFGTGDGYGPRDGYGTGRRTARDDWQQAPAAAGPADEPDAEDDDEAAGGGRRGKRKGGVGKRLSMRLGHRDEEADIWPDDDVSDEDYWASVATERSLPPTDRPADATPRGGLNSGAPNSGASGVGGGARGGMNARPGDPRQGPPTDPRLAPPARQSSPPRPAAGLAQPGTGSVRFGSNAPETRAERQPGYPEPNGYPDPRDLRPSARPPGRHGAPGYGNDPLTSPAYSSAPPDAYQGSRHAQVPPDRYQAALTEQTQTFDMPDGAAPQAPPAQYPRGAIGSGAPSGPAGAAPGGGQPSGGQPSGGQPSGGQPSGGQPSGGQPSGGRHSRQPDDRRSPRPYQDQRDDPYHGRRR